MHYSVGVEYALHSLLSLARPTIQQPICIKDLAAFHGVSESYLSKIFTKLTKAGIVQSIPGVKGGYELAKSPEMITFLEVVEAIEGKQPIFQCRNILAKGLPYQQEGSERAQMIRAGKIPCRINLTMLEAEEQMRTYLQGKTLRWLQEILAEELPAEVHQQTENWFRQRLK
jgi:Rrf2 family protein